MNRLATIIFALLISMQMLADTKMELAKKASESKDYGTVIECTTLQIIEQPKDAEAYYYRAAAYVAVQEYGKALKDADKAISFWNKKYKDFTLTDLYGFRAAIYEHIEDYGKAVADYDMAIKKDPKNIVAYINRARFNYRIQAFDKAEADYSIALVMNEDDSDLKVEIARCQLAQSKFDEAYLVLNTLTKLEPRNEEACRLFSLVYLYKDEIKNFIDQYVRFLDMASNGDLSLLAYGASKEYNYTILTLTRALNSSDNKAYWLGVRARVKRENERYKDAIEDLKRMEDIYADSIENPFVYYQMALSYDGLYDYKNAIKYYNRLLDYEERTEQINPFDYVNRADALLNNNEIEMALADCDKALSFATEGISNIYYMRGWINDMARNYEASFEDYNKAIDVEEDPIASAYVMRGKNYLLHKNDSVRAKADFEIVLQKDTIVQASSVRHYALLYLGRLNEAKDWMSELLKADPQNAGKHYDAACLFARMGDNEQAVDFLCKAFDLGYRNLYHIAQDDDLDTLRERDDFNQLLNKYKQRNVGNLFNKLL